MSMRLQRTGPKPRPGIVHLGPGAFFRAFNAVYTDDAMAASEGDWGIIAASLRSAFARDALVPQGCAYTSVTLAADPAPRVIGSVCDVLVAPEDPLRLCNAMARAETRIVSLTITEKGYCRAAAEDRLDMHHADIAHDLQNPGAPRSAVALIVAALALRWRAGLDPFTILSCDNLPSNGGLLRQLVLDFAGASVPEMVPWIEDAVAFPSTMVDRITPATTEQDRARLADMTGYEDRACVFHEPFRQWVIEDSFCAGRPVWEAGGALFVKDVQAHEVMKLRCLNGTHSALAYLGYLAGHETIADVTADADFVRYCQRLWTEEILPTVPCPEGEDLEVYCARLLARYQNRVIQHRTWQIAMDGSQKVPQRLLQTISDQFARGKLPEGLCLAVAGWMRYARAVDEKGNPIDVRDPMAKVLRRAGHASPDPAGQAQAFLDLSEVFGTLGQNPEFQDAVTRWYVRLAAEGAAATVARCAAGG